MWLAQMIADYVLQIMYMCVNCSHFLFNKSYYYVFYHVRVQSFVVDDPKELRYDCDLITFFLFCQIFLLFNCIFNRIEIFCTFCQCQSTEE